MDVMRVGHPTLDRVTESEFYAIIDAARPGTTPETPSADPDVLYDVLSSRTGSEVEAFAAEFRRQMVRLNRWSVWDAGYAASGGLSGDAFHYFRTWLIGKGAAVVELALTTPDELALYLDTEELENKALEYVADELLEERGVEVDESRGTDVTDAEPAGEPFDEDTSAERHPRLAAWFDEVSAGY